MKEIYQQTVEEVLKQVGSKELGLTSGMSLQKARKKILFKFSLNSIKIFWYLF